MKILWNIITLVAVVGTYIGAWHHDVVVMLLCFFPQLIAMGYKIAKEI